jgi:hypothetical protein
LYLIIITIGTNPLSFWHDSCKLKTFDNFTSRKAIYLSNNASMDKRLSAAMIPITKGENLKAAMEACLQ